MEMQLEGRGEQLVKRQKVGLKELQELALTTSFSSSASPHGWPTQHRRWASHVAARTWINVPASAQALLPYGTACQRTLRLWTFAWTQEQQDKSVEEEATEAVKCRRHPPSIASTHRSTYVAGGSLPWGGITGLMSSSLVIYSGHCENSKILCQMLQYCKVVSPDFSFSCSACYLIQNKTIDQT